MDEKQLARLVHVLNDGDNHFFIHVDKKKDINPFINAIGDEDISFCTFLADRYWVQWGGYNQVRYQQALLRACLDNNTHFNRVFIITGQDYPLRSLAEIKYELEKNPEREYIIGLNISNLQYPRMMKDKIELYHFFRDLNIHSSLLKKMLCGGSRQIMRLLPFRKDRFVNVGGRQWPVYMSSSYMCITMNMAKYLLSEMDNNREVMHYFRYSFVPEEMIIPTIVFNSEYASRTLGVRDHYEGLMPLSSITYFNYGKKIQIFNEYNYDELIASGKWFARKFQTGISDTLMEMLKKSDT